jgi:hypothetical protein
MEPGQEWCLECGAARTVIARPPDWRIPVLVIAVVVLLIAGGFAYGLSRLGSGAGKVTVVRTSAVNPSSASGTSALAAWEPGLAGYTVVLATHSSQSAADRAGQALRARFADVGVLESSEHPQMIRQGVWDVFAGHYPSYATAKAAAARAVRHGQPGAKPALVQRPGQG